jgi:hypothetical protein
MMQRRTSFRSHQVPTRHGCLLLVGTVVGCQVGVDAASPLYRCITGGGESPGDGG